MIRPASARLLPLALVAALAAAPVLAGCSTSPGGAELTAENAFMPQPVNDAMAAGFLVVRNDGDADDRLTGATSDISDDVQLHETSGNAMRQVDSLTVPAGGELELRRGGNHLMFMELKRKPEQGDTVSVELQFAKSDPISIELPVESAVHNPQQ